MVLIPFVIFLLACLAVYLGTIEVAFSALMQLSLRLSAERSDRPTVLSGYLDDPAQLFAPVRLLLGLTTAIAAAFLTYTIGVEGPDRWTLIFVSIAAFVLICELLLPLALVGRDPERALEWLLPTFKPLARALEPVMRLTARAMVWSKRAPVAATPEEVVETAAATDQPHLGPEQQEKLIEGEERRLLQSIVDFGGTLVREVMTPRPDIVGIPEEATIGGLRALFREQEYSRFPVFKDSLDNIAGFVFVKDLLALSEADDERPVRQLLRPAVVVPESKRVSELLKQFQRHQTQIAIVVDEYGGTAGLVTIEDMLEEIVGEIRDEYDVELEPIADEGGGRFVVFGKVDIDKINDRLNVSIAREGFETVGGFLLARLGRVPAVGEQFEVDGLQVEVLEVDRRRVHKVRLARLQPVEAPEKQGAV